MKTLRIINDHPPGSLQNPAFRYKKANETDVAKTFARIRRELATQAGATQYFCFSHGYSPIL